MKKLAAVVLIGLLLSVTVVGSNYHNHPLTNRETPDCPAYIISLFVQSNVPVCALDIPAPSLQNAVKLQPLETVGCYGIQHRVLSNKSPPAL